MDDPLLRFVRVSGNNDATHNFSYNIIEHNKPVRSTQFTPSKGHISTLQQQNRIPPPPPAPPRFPPHFKQLLTLKKIQNNTIRRLKK